MDNLSIVLLMTCVGGCVFVALCSFRKTNKRKGNVSEPESGSVYIIMEDKTNPGTQSIDEHVEHAAKVHKKRKTHTFSIPVLVGKQSELLNKFVPALGKGLREKPSIEMILLNKDTFSDQCEKLVMVICNNNERLVSDVESSLEGLQFSHRRVFLVVVHCKEETDLPTIPTAVKLQSDETVSDICTVVDMAFTRNQGIYKCDMNDKALAKIRSYVNREEFCNCHLQNDTNISVCKGFCCWRCC